MISNNKNIVNIAVRIACNTRYKTGRKNTISNTAVSSQTRIIIIAISDTGYIVKRVHPGTVTSTQKSYGISLKYVGKERNGGYSMQNYFNISAHKVGLSRGGIGAL